MAVSASAGAAGGLRGRGVIAHYRRYLPVTDDSPVVTLGEGDTPLVAAPSLGAALGVELYLKLEGTNPTCSFKDRGMTMALTKVVEEGYRAVICASTGNTSASAAAYAAKAGVRAIVVIPEGKIAMGKLAQAVAYGAHVISIAGNFDVALDIVREAAATLPIALVNSVNPYRIEARRPAPSRSATPWAARPPITASRWATLATSRATGRVTASTARPASSTACP